MFHFGPEVTLGEATKFQNAHLFCHGNKSIKCETWILKDRQEVHLPSTRGISENLTHKKHGFFMLCLRYPEISVSSFWSFFFFGFFYRDPSCAFLTRWPKRHGKLWHWCENDVFATGKLGERWNFEQLCEIWRDNLTTWILEVYPTVLHYIENHFEFTSASRTTKTSFLVRWTQLHWFHRSSESAANRGLSAPNLLLFHSCTL